MAVSSMCGLVPRGPSGCAGGNPVQGEPESPLTEEQREYNRGARCRIVVEHTLAQRNWFPVLHQVFRGQQRSRHGQVVRVVTRWVNRRLRVKPLKTYAT
ncbi:MAG TPA: hypothetical protein VFA18_19450 [Gemmataceae bacterium]|nr:hypothetical protein [Gemmataceae bacterium]